MEQNNKKSVKNNIIISILIVGFIVCALTLGTIFDLQISNAICILPLGQYFCSNIFVVICEIFGESVLYFLLMFSFAVIFIFFFRKQTKNKFTKNMFIVCSIILGFAVAILFIFKTLEYAQNYMSKGFNNFVNYTQSKILFVLIGFAFFVLFLFLTFKLKEEVLNNLLKWAFIVIFVAILSNSLVKILKIIFNRTRFRAMLYVGDTEFNYFTNWFVINKNTFPSLVSFGEDFFKSFPSGHACASALIFSLCLLPNFINKLNTKKWKTSFIVLSLIYTCLICFSRILCGAHFFTDVFIGAIITIFILFITNLICNKFLNKLFEKIEKL